MVKRCTNFRHLLCRFLQTFQQNDFLHKGRTYVTYQRQHRSRHTPETYFRRKGIASQDVDIHGINALSR